MIELRCKGEVDGKVCDRFLKIEPVATTITKVTCNDRRCKFVNNVKVIFSDATPEQIRYKFEEQNDG